MIPVKYDQISLSIGRLTTHLSLRDQQIQVKDLVDVNRESLSKVTPAVLIVLTTRKWSISTTIKMAAVVMNGFNGGSGDGNDSHFNNGGNGGGFGNGSRY